MSKKIYGETCRQGLPMIPPISEEHMTRHWGLSKNKVPQHPLVNPD